MINVLLGMLIGVVIMFFIFRNRIEFSKNILAQNLFYRDEVVKALVKYIGHKERDMGKSSLFVPHCFFATNDEVILQLPT